MGLIIEARLSDGDSDTYNDVDGVLAVVERDDFSLAQRGRPLAEERAFLGKVDDEDMECDIAKLPQTVADVQVRESSHVASVSVDSAWLRHCDSVGGQGRHVNIVAGRATFADGPPKLYAYVHKEVTSTGARLDQFLSRNGVGIDERVTLISEDAGELAKTVEGRQRGRGARLS